MTSDKTSKIATAAGFLAGVIACLDAVRDVKTLWPPGALWQVLQRPRRLELLGGIALIVVTLIVSALRKRPA